MNKAKNSYPVRNATGVFEKTRKLFRLGNSSPLQHGHELFRRFLKEFPPDEKKAEVAIQTIENVVCGKWQKDEYNLTKILEKEKMMITQLSKNEGLSNNQVRFHLNQCRATVVKIFELSITEELPA